MSRMLSYARQSGAVLLLTHGTTLAAGPGQEPVQQPCWDAPINGQVENQRRKCSAMNSLVLQKTAIDRDLTAKYAIPSLPSRLLPQQKPARLRRKGPVFWAMLALLVLAADFLLALLAWLAVDLVMK
ncbi:hypothetical protein [Bradyrhizobium centrolobii]|uniref:hypothetical protein n=1 Tax=Bradyrhizobium centrolobii TaxID=1505087 RepID=UPI001FD9E3F6|nr:hypothetical protein [Bradyrhizobium centrolobii]